MIHHHMNLDGSIPNQLVLPTMMTVPLVVLHRPKRVLHQKEENQKIYGAFCFMCFFFFFVGTALYSTPPSNSLIPCKSHGPLCFFFFLLYRSPFTSWGLEFSDGTYAIFIRSMPAKMWSIFWSDSTGSRQIDSKCADWVLPRSIFTFSCLMARWGHLATWVSRVFFLVKFPGGLGCSWSLRRNGNLWFLVHFVFLILPFAPFWLWLRLCR